MKFSGTGSTAFYDLKKYLRSKNKPEPAPERKLKPAPEKASHSRWETKIREMIERSLEQDDTRVFPLDGGMTYRPDYILSHVRDGRKTIVQIDEEITDLAVARYRSFMKRLGNAYFMIAVVKDGQLRKWNDADQGRGMLYDEVWVGDDVSDMIRRIKNPPKTVSHVAICSACNKTLDDIAKIKRDFPYRVKEDGSIDVNSKCRVCKEAHETTKPKYTIRTSHKCIGCGIQFSTTIASCLYCDQCTQKLNL